MTPRLSLHCLRLFMCVALVFVTACGGATQEEASEGDAPGRNADETTSQEAEADETPLFAVNVDEAGGVIAAFEEGDDGLLGRYIHSAGLTAGLGSNPVGLDRGLGDAGRIIAIRRVGEKIIIEQENWTYRATADNPEEKQAVQDSFASSILWAGDVYEEEDGLVSVDLSEFLASDVMNVAGRLKARGQGTYKFDPKRSFVPADGVLQFPDNIEVDARITFAGAEAGGQVSAVAANGLAFSLTLHHSFVRLPEPGFQSRAFDVRTGAIGVSYYDFSAPLGEQVIKGIARRFRLERVDPSLEKGPVKKPIIMYVDRGAPEPIRSALIEGASWWAEAFEAAGFEDGYRVEVLPEGVHPMDVRYNTIQWVHRQTRGWSYGGGVHDPRTGEMLKARVILGSQRVRQDRMIFEGLAGVEKTGSGEPDDPLELSLARIRQLSAHEVGHTLGFAHNFAASSNNRASVMDYPAPYVRPNGSGGLDFSQAYGVGVGAWDVFATRWLYRQFADGANEDAELEEMVDEAYASGLRFVDDAQARSAATAHPYGAVWDNGADPVATLEETMRVRATALAGFGERSLKTGEPISRLRQVITPIYLYHRYQTAAAVKLIGGIDFRHAEKGDVNAVGAPVPAERQRLALGAILSTLDPSGLDLPDGVLNRLSPSVNAFDGEGEGEEHFDGTTGAMFDLTAAADAAADLTLSVLFHPARVARVIEIERRGGAPLRYQEMLRGVEDTVFGPQVNARTIGIARIVQSRYVSTLIDLAADPSAKPEIAARTDAYLKALRNRLNPGLLVAATDDRAFREWLAARIDAHLVRPAPERPVIAPQPETPPGSPIGAASTGTIGVSLKGHSSDGVREECWFCQ